MQGPGERRSSVLALQCLEAGALLTDSLQQSMTADVRQTRALQQKDNRRYLHLLVDCDTAATTWRSVNAEPAVSLFNNRG